MPKNLTGQTFGRLTAIRIIGSYKGQGAIWLCRCACGKETNVRSGHLSSGNSTSCGCFRADSNALDLTGQRFGRLLVVRPLGTGAKGRIWHCQCDCGNTVNAAAGDLTSGHTKGCRCFRTFEDLTGQCFWRLTVISPSVRSRRPGQSHSWLCRCECGKIVTARGDGLKNGDYKSCGCFRRDTQAVLKRSHGLSRTKEYRAFQSARQRCTNKNDTAWRNYGGRGIQFRFKSFLQFMSELGFKPGPNYSLDRYPNNDGHYEVGNVRWATKRQQSINKRRNLRAAA